MGAIQQLMAAYGGASSPLDPLWTPADLDGPLGFWFNDDSAVTDAGAGACSQWNDIGGLANHAVQATAGERPTIISAGLNGRRILDFDGGDDFNLPSGALGLLNATRGCYAAVVYRHDQNDASDTYRILVTFATASTTGRFTMFAGSGASGGKNKFGIAARRADADALAFATSPTERVGSWNIGIGIVRFEGRSGSVVVNGETDASFSSAWSAGGATAASNSLRARIGAGVAAAPDGFIDGSVAELVFLAGAVPSQDEIDRVTGYLAHRWGLAGNLDPAHPYKANAPTTVKDPHFGSVVSLLQMHGPQDSLMFPDKKRKVWTPLGDAKIDRTDPDFPDGCALLDGSGDYLETPDHIDFELGGGDFAIDVSAKFAGYPVNNAGSYWMSLITKDNSGSNRGWNLSVVGTASSIDWLYFWGFETNVIIHQVNTPYSFSLNTRYDISVRRIGNLLYMFVNGVCINPGGTTFNVNIQNSSATVRIGRNYTATYPQQLNGRVGSVRVTKGVGRGSEDYTPTSFPNS